jgi:signal transduction histidine kinase
MVLRVTRSGHYLDLHSADGRADRYLSRPASEVIGRHVSDVFDAEFARRQEEHCLHALATGDIQRWEYARMIDGEEAYFEARFVKSGDDEVVITVRDITQRVALEREVIATTERERTRIGHDLHDGIAQVLTGAKWSLEALRDKLAAADSKCSSDAERAVDLVRTAIEQTRNLAEGLSPIRKGGKLAEALEHLAKQSTRLLGVECRVGRTRISDDLSDTAATHLYRIAQEAITNAVKHGKSSRIDISCDRVQQRLVLSIVDNGIGAVEAARSGGMGMHIMSYRARSLGGELTVSRRRSGGMTVKCTCPWPGAQHAAMQKAAGE